MRADFLDIDPLNLVEELRVQPRLRLEWGEKLADARKDYELAKRRKDVVVAELDREVRSSPESFGLSKVTEGAVEKTVILQKRYQKADDDLIEARHYMDLVQAKLAAVDDRKKSLEGTVSLQIAGYYAEPRIRGEAGERMRERKAEQAFKPSKPRKRGDNGG